MTTRITATLTDGVFRPDERVPLADQSRVHLTIEPIDDRPASIAAWQSLRARLVARPIHAAGVRYTRDELHERR